MINEDVCGLFWEADSSIMIPNSGSMVGARDLLLLLHLRLEADNEAWFEDRPIKTVGQSEPLETVGTGMSEMSNDESMDRFYVPKIPLNCSIYFNSHCLRAHHWPFVLGMRKITIILSEINYLLTLDQYLKYWQLKLHNWATCVRNVKAVHVLRHS